MVKPKKYLGQHFLKDDDIAREIVNSLTGYGNYRGVLEVGPGKGKLTQYLLSSNWKLYCVEKDIEAVEYLEKKYSIPKERLITGDILKMNMEIIPFDPLGLIGNFPYNISSQIFFKILDHKDKISEVVCMVQKEVAARIASLPGNKQYGILSVFLQAFYDIEYLFEVPPGVFHPPPKVESAVIRLQRNKVLKLNCDETLWRTIIKQGFQNRRKKLRNALKPLNLPEEIKTLEIMNLRAEQLSVSDFISLTNHILGHD